MASGWVLICNCGHPNGEPHIMMSDADGQAVAVMEGNHLQPWPTRAAALEAKRNRRYQLMAYEEAMVLYG